MSQQYNEEAISMLKKHNLIVEVDGEYSLGRDYVILLKVVSSWSQPPDNDDVKSGEYRRRLYQELMEAKSIPKEKREIMVTCLDIIVTELEQTHSE